MQLSTVMWKVCSAAANRLRTHTLVRLEGILYSHGFLPQGIQPRQGTVCSVNSSFFRGWSGAAGAECAGRQPLLQSTGLRVIPRASSCETPPDTQKGWITSPGLASLMQWMQDAPRTLHNTNQSIANADNREICSEMLCWSKLSCFQGSPGNCLITELTCQTCWPDELPSAACFQGALLPTVLSHLGVWRLLPPTSAANSTRERTGKQLLCNVGWNLQVTPAPPASLGTREQGNPSTFPLLETHP